MQGLTADHPPKRTLHLNEDRFRRLASDHFIHLVLASFSEDGFPNARDLFSANVEAQVLGVWVFNFRKSMLFALKWDHMARSWLIPVKAA